MASGWRVPASDRGRSAANARFEPPLQLPPVGQPAGQGGADRLVGRGGGQPAGGGGDRAEPGGGGQDDLEDDGGRAPAAVVGEPEVGGQPIQDVAVDVVPGDGIVAPTHGSLRAWRLLQHHCPEGPCVAHPSTAEFGTTIGLGSVRRRPGTSDSRRNTACFSIAPCPPASGAFRRVGYRLATRAGTAESYRAPTTCPYLNPRALGGSVRVPVGRIRPAKPGRPGHPLRGS